MKEITKWIDDGAPVEVVYLDFQKAFDKVPHQRLLLKLKAHGIGKDVINWIEKWLTHRSRVIADGEIPQPAHNVGTTMIISCIYVATSNNINTSFSQRLVIDVTRTWKYDVATTLKSSRQPNPTSSQCLFINVIRTWKVYIHATM